MVVFEFTLPAEEFLLAEPLAEHPDVVIEFEQLVPANHSPMPYLWTADGDAAGFREALAAAPTVDRVRRAATFDEGALYGIEWNRGNGGLIDHLMNDLDEVACLQAQGKDGEWQLKFRFPSRDALSAFRDFYEARGIDVRVVRLYDLTDPKLGEYNVSRKQRTALLRALEMGHFEIPREATLEEVADSLDISPKSLSERLRRGQTNLVSNTLTVGQPTGVGVGEQ